MGADRYKAAKGIAWDATMAECVMGPAMAVALCLAAAGVLYLLGFERAAGTVAGFSGLIVVCAVFVLPIALAVDIGRWWRGRRAAPEGRRGGGGPAAVTCSSRGARVSTTEAPPKRVHATQGMSQTSIMPR
ncbi:MAG: hypothetical protein L6R19_27510 [Alphaproteobacteria bacterium]|nr:hypothetical protein [Alphaproteobacteria bacterium]